MMYICKAKSHWLKKSELKDGKCPHCGSSVVEDDVPEVDFDEESEADFNQRMASYIGFPED